MKKKSVILQMLYGQRGGANNMKFIPETAPYIDIIDECFEKIKEKLEEIPEVWELFLKYNKNIDSVQLLTLDAHYLEGFKFGLLMGIEAGESKFEE